MTMVGVRDRKKLTTRSRIIAEAIRIFAERGIEATTVDNIAEAAEVGKGTIYNYFDTKEDIVVAFLVDLERTVQKEAARCAKANGPASSILTAFVRVQFKLKEPHHEFVRVFLAQMFGRGNSFLPWIQELQLVIDPPLEQLFSTLQERKLIRDDVPIGDIVQIFKMVHLGLTATWVIEGPPWRATEQLTKREMQLFCEGLQAVRE